MAVRISWELKSPSLAYSTLQEGHILLISIRKCTLGTLRFRDATSPTGLSINRLRGMTPLSPLITSLLSLLFRRRTRRVSIMIRVCRGFKIP
jgi:hypothetical protein